MNRCREVAVPVPPPDDAGDDELLSRCPRGLVEQSLRPMLSLMLTAGSIGDIRGHRRTFLVGLGVFSGGAAVSAAAPVVAVLVVGREVGVYMGLTRGIDSGRAGARGSAGRSGVLYISLRRRGR